MIVLERLTAAVVLAAPAEPPPGKGPEWGKAAPIGLLVILLLCAAMWLLFRNMSKHLRKVRESAAADEFGAAAAELSTGAGSSGAQASGAGRPGAQFSGPAGPPDEPAQESAEGAAEPWPAGRNKERPTDPN